MQETLVHTEDRVQYAICRPCAVLYFNGMDVPTWEDYAEEYCAGDMETVGFIRNFLEDHPMLMPEGDYNPGGYWECECCHEIMIGDGEVLEAFRGSIPNA